jgi:hypothetical protein
MAREIPEVVRAAAGLAATVLDEARKLPETLPGLPVRVIGLAMQKAMWLQQQYAGLVARGDELFTGIHGENEPGLATFDDDVPEPDLPAATGFRDSAFDRAPEPPADEDTADLAREAVEELALEDLIDDEALGLSAEQEVIAAVEAHAEPDEAADEAADEVDVPTADGGVTTVEAGVTDEGVAAPEPPAETAEEGGTPFPSTSPPATAPVEGYDDWSIAQLRGRLRGYVSQTVQELLAYEEATRAREPYLRMLRNRLEKVQSESA